ncbi:ABC transporter substrate-binding protein [Bosea caraganae]|uniref:ABC transporter substrate-binding protein n=1 Tax=Bosea caraganae TaxID=2763117 RepID=A0A370L0P7_9HYPH|nr:ABC transporter substrate-binding protein [Bosea caraganae]RDJ20811.1 ABC transporter substrate-binding protein [Bosea caraganae]RDJ21576.1 ABC transporter substrate-binding protein [Bosea caraganae]
MSANEVQGSFGRRRLFGLLGALGAALVSFSGFHSASAQTPVRFTLDWRFEGPAALFLMAQEKGYFKAEGLDVTIDAGNGSRESIPRVASGAYDAGFGDVNALIRYRDENPSIDLKAVMMVYDRPPFAIVGRKSRGVTSDVKTLEGKKFGAPAADAAFAHWPIFKAVNKIDDSKIRLENVGFPVREPMLAAGEVDAVFGFANSSFINLKARGVPADDIVTLLMADYGVELYGNAVMVSPKFAAEKPDAVRGLLRAITQSIKDAIANPEIGGQLVIKRNDIARLDVEVERLKMTIEQNVMTPWARTNGFGGIDPARWVRALDQLALAAPFRDKERAGTAFTESYLPPHEQRKF